MNTQELVETANALVSDGKGLLAMDESSPTRNKRFAGAKDEARWPDRLGHALVLVARGVCDPGA